MTDEQRQKAQAIHGQFQVLLQQMRDERLLDRSDAARFWSVSITLFEQAIASFGYWVLGVGR